MAHTVEEKYAFLLSVLKVRDVDWWEGDALLVLPDGGVYFQFPLAMMHEPERLTVDYAVEAAMDDWFRARGGS